MSTPTENTVNNNEFVFMPMKIKINLENQKTQLSDMPFDSILAKLYFDEQKLNNTFKGDYDINLPFLKETDGVYHTSNPIYNVQSLHNDFIKKSFDMELYKQIGENNFPRGIVEDKDKGHFKPYLIEFEVQIIESIEYYINADYSTIERLLNNLRYLGKMSRVGYGKIASIEIESQTEDFSLVRDNNPMRHLPDTKQFNNLKNITKVMMPLKPPYWKNERSKPVIIANN